jgi:hypothetical protein
MFEMRCNMQSLCIILHTGRRCKMMARCIQLDMECAALCYAAAQLMSLGSDKAKEVCQLCADICEACGNECSKHTHSKHCQECAEACKACAEECRKM